MKGKSLATIIICIISVMILAGCGTVTESNSADKPEAVEEDAEIAEDSEKEADMFAGYLLMPYDALFQYSKKVDKWTLNKIIDLEQFFLISHMAIMFRLEKDGYMAPDSLADYKNVTISREAAKLGYGKELYFPDQIEKQYFTTGEYVRKVEKIYDKGLISEGKKEELLLDGFRADIVYNIDEEEGNLND